MDIKILGTGCKKCETLEMNTRQAVEALGIQAEIEKVKDFKEIASYGVLKTPGLVVDGKALISGKVPSVDEIKNLLGN
ncbi:small redox-active disulfide protein 2 [Tindallia magadiensis]|uniref:Small redox-active disulfide protein 2 n=1 Tax=Tindallia magadiensis TaxID=69895 RepID=A0A1I3DTL3_9FIRM|nr:thioredoxin family protein [Tindallia magadiensis]SFH89841.1 small redox-active disulfide protein 2 [Tindallia magadiensis]